ncbi:MAG: hypothetical protein QNK40_00685 [Desulfobacterales bacterium]|nr:hypothetical protein [Desulfobacterales bacterium]
MTPISVQPCSKTAVEPIRNLKDINAIKKNLHDKPRDLAIFILGINTNLRTSDIINIKVKQVTGTDELVQSEKKTGKTRRITLNPQVKAVV